MKVTSGLKRACVGTCGSSACTAIFTALPVAAV